MKSSLTSLRDALVTLRDALRGAPLNPSSPDDDLFRDTNPLPTGAFTIDKRPEDITKNDVLNALALPDLFQGVPVIDKTWEFMLQHPEDYAEFTALQNPKPFIWTANGAKLIGRNVVFNKKGVESTATQTLSGEESDWWKDKTLNPDYSKDYTPRTDRIAFYNARRLKDIQNAHDAIDSQVSTTPEPNCVGLKLDRVYPVRFSGSISYRRPATFLSTLFNPKRDFIIDGEVEGKAVGGFMSRYGLLAATHSLVLRKARFTRKDEQNYYSIFVDCRLGVEQLQVTDCVFEQCTPTSEDLNTRAGHGYGTKYIYLYFENRSPFTTTERTQLTDTNVLRHLLVKGNTVYGTSFLTSHMARFSLSYRAIDNTFFEGRAEDNLEAGRNYYVLEGAAGSAISHVIANPGDLADASTGIDENGVTKNTSYAILLAYNSCPMWYVANRFYGSDRIIAKRATYTTSNEALGLETAQAYILRNDFKNYVSKHTIYDGDPAGKYAEKHYAAHANYETYNSVTKLWFANNNIENVVALSHHRSNARAIFKSKGTCVPYTIRNQWKFAKVVRYYVGNKISFNKQWLWDRWLDATGQKERYVDGRQYDPYDPFTTYGITVRNVSGDGNNWNPEKWLIEDKYGHLEPMPVIAKKCNSCGRKLDRQATVCTKASCQSTDLENIYPADKFPYLVGERTYDQIFQKGLDQNGQFIENIDTDGIDHEFKENIALAFSEILQETMKKSHHINTPVYWYIFKNNVIDLGPFCLGGMVDTSSINAVNFICRGNTFKARRIASVYDDNGTKRVLWSSKRLMKNTPNDEVEDEYVFNIVPCDYYGATIQPYDDMPVSEKPTMEQIAADDTLELHNGMLVTRTGKATVEIADNKFCVEDFTLDGNTIPTEVKFIRVKYGGKPVIYRDLINPEDPDKGTERLRGIASPATVIIDNNHFINQDGSPVQDSQNTILYHKSSATNWGVYRDLTPTTP